MTAQHGQVISASTDGACSGNPGPGGWGVLIRFEDGSVTEFGGYEPATTNNRMELRAMLEVFKHLQNLPLHPELTIKTDSKYLINGLNNWIKGWKKNGWRTSSGKPVLNQDLWQALDRSRLQNVPLEFVKGHSGNKDNERVDAIAVSHSKSRGMKLDSQEASNSSKGKNKVTLNSSVNINKPIQGELEKLISRLDMINHIAHKGYSLNTNELSELLETPANELNKKEGTWKWRDWFIEPIGDSQWKLKTQHQKKSCTEENKSE